MDSSLEIASVQFADWNDLYNTEKPFQIFMDIPKDSPDQRSTNLGFSPLDIRIADIRGREEKFKLDEHGFRIASLENDPSYTDHSKFESDYLPAIEKLIKREVEGADRVYFFDWRRRNADATQDRTKISHKDLDDRNQYIKPSNTAHVDQAPIAALNRVRSQMGRDADLLMNGRIRIINIWRPLLHEVSDWPLALCDGSTVQKSDFLETDQVRETYIGSAMFLMKNDTMKWYYLRKQRPNEVLLFKQFDSMEGVKARYCPHAAFMHRKIPPQSPPRMSVEVRALVFSDPGR